MTAVPRFIGARRPARGFGAALLTMTGLAGSFAAAACCALPFLLATAGFGTAWLGGIAFAAAPYRVPLLVVSAISLTGGAALWWRQRGGACSRTSACTRPAVRAATLTGLLAGLVLLYLGYAYV